MDPAHVLRLKHEHTHPPGKTRREARSGDPAADDNDVELLHSGRWLRFVKARRLGVVA